MKVGSGSKGEPCWRDFRSYKGCFVAQFLETGASSVSFRIFPSMFPSMNMTPMLRESGFLTICLVLYAEG